jgi:hypothetical protein
MSEVLWREVLAAQADDLALGGTEKRAEEYAELFPAHADTLIPLLNIAEQTSRLLSRRAKPDGEFREELHRSLIAQARQQQATGPDGRRRWIIGAAAFGSAVSVAGLVAYFMWQRNSPAAFKAE